MLFSLLSGWQCASGFRGFYASSYASVLVSLNSFTHSDNFYNEMSMIVPSYFIFKNEKFHLASMKHYNFLFKTITYIRSNMCVSENCAWILEYKWACAFLCLPVWWNIGHMLTVYEISPAQFELLIIISRPLAPRTKVIDCNLNLWFWVREWQSDWRWEC